MSGTCSLFSPFGDPWPSCLLPSQHELSDVQAGFRKGRGTREQIVNICWVIEKARVPEKTSISALLPMPKPLNV